MASDEICGSPCILGVTLAKLLLQPALEPD